MISQSNPFITYSSDRCNCIKLCHTLQAQFYPFGCNPKKAHTFQKISTFPLRWNSGTVSTQFGAHGCVIFVSGLRHRLQSEWVCFGHQSKGYLKQMCLYIVSTLTWKISSFSHCGCKHQIHHKHQGDGIQAQVRKREIKMCLRAEYLNSQYRQWRARDLLVCLASSEMSARISTALMELVDTAQNTWDLCPLWLADGGQRETSRMSPDAMFKQLNLVLTIEISYSLHCRQIHFLNIHKGNAIFGTPGCLKYLEWAGRFGIQSWYMADIIYGKHKSFFSSKGQTISDCGRLMCP